MPMFVAGLPPEQRPATPAFLAEPDVRVSHCMGTLVERRCTPGGEVWSRPMFEGGEFHWTGSGVPLRPMTPETALILAGEARRLGEEHE